MPKKNKRINHPSEKRQLEEKSLIVTYIGIDDIIPNNYNPNRQSEHEFELLCRSIEEDGFTQPILINKENMRIVDGEHRWRALKALGYKTMPVVMTTMSEIQAKIATLRHNRARGSEDIQKAADIIRDLEISGVLDWAADSLIMDTVELSLLTKTIPENELQFRSENMSYEETVETIKKEEEAKKVQREEEILMSKSDTAKYTLQFSFIAKEAILVRAVIGKDQAAGIKKLCEEMMA